MNPDQDKIVPVFTEEVNLFRPVQMNVAEQAVRWKTWNPSFVGQTSPQRVLFSYPNVGTDYVDLSRTQVYMKLKIIEESTSAVFAETAEDFATPIDLIMHTMWENIIIKLNGQIVSSSNNTYGYKAFIEHLVTSGEQSKKFQGSFIGSSPDTRYFDQVLPDKAPINQGLQKRRQLFEKIASGSTNVAKATRGRVQSVEYCGKLFADLCNQERYLLNEVGLEITMIPNNDAFRLMVHGNKKARLHIEDIKLQICHVSLQPAVKMQIDKILNPNEAGPTLPALYPMGRVTVTPVQIPKDSFQMVKTDLWQGEVPSRVVVGLVSSEAFEGHYQKNPFFFNHYNIASISFKLGNEDVPGEPMTLNIQESDYLLGLVSLYQVASKHVSDAELSVDRNTYREGLTLFGFTIDPSAQEDAGQRGLPRRDLSTLMMKFRQATPHDITAIIYATFHDEVSIDHSRVVRVKSNRL